MGRENFLSQLPRWDTILAASAGCEWASAGSRVYYQQYLVMKVPVGLAPCSRPASCVLTSRTATSQVAELEAGSRWQETPKIVGRCGRASCIFRGVQKSGPESGVLLILSALKFLTNRINGIGSRLPAHAPSGCFLGEAVLMMELQCTQTARDPHLREAGSRPLRN